MNQEVEMHALALFEWVENEFICDDCRPKENRMAGCASCDLLRAFELIANALVDWDDEDSELHRRLKTIGRSGKSDTAMKLVASRLPWKSIEDAPKDGSQIIGLEDDGEVYRCWWQKDGIDGSEYWQNEADSEPDPKFWLEYQKPVQGF